jgi:hypothetical protein
MNIECYSATAYHMPGKDIPRGKFTLIELLDTCENKNSIWEIY